MEFMSVTAAVFQPLRGGLKAPALKNLASERATRGASVSVSVSVSVGVTTPEYPGSTSGGEQEESQAADRDTRRACSYDCLTRAGVEDWRGTRESGSWWSDPESQTLESRLEEISS